MGTPAMSVDRYWVFTDGECPPRPRGDMVPHVRDYGFGDVLYSIRVQRWYFHDGRGWSQFKYKQPFQPTKEQLTWALMLT